MHTLSLSPSLFTVKCFKHKNCWWTLAGFQENLGQREEEDLNNPIRNLKKVQGFPGGSDGEESASNVGDLGLIPGLGRSPGEENGNSPQYSCLESSMDRGTWWLQSRGRKESDATEWLSLSCLSHPNRWSAESPEPTRGGSDY